MGVRYRENHSVTWRLRPSMGAAARHPRQLAAALPSTSCAPSAVVSRRRTHPATRRTAIPVSEVGSTLHAVLGPRLHDRAPSFQEVGSSIRRLRLAADRVSETRLCYVSRHASLTAPVPERTTRPVHCRVDSESPQQRTPRPRTQRALDATHEPEDQVPASRQSHLFEHFELPSRQRNAMRPAGLRARPRHPPDCGLGVDLLPARAADLSGPGSRQH